MIRLTQRAWNNVIIFSTLVLILLFNFSSNFLNDGSDAKQTERGLIPHGRVITTIKFDQQKIERIGQGWRSTIAKSNNQNLSDLVAYWHDSKIVPVQNQVDLTRQDLIGRQKITVWFAGQSEPVQYEFLTYPDNTVVMNDGNPYLLIQPPFKKLISPE